MVSTARLLRRRGGETVADACMLTLIGGRRALQSVLACVLRRRSPSYCVDWNVLLVARERLRGPVLSRHDHAARVAACGRGRAGTRAADETREQRSPVQYCTAACRVSRSISRRDEWAAVLRTRLWTGDGADLRSSAEQLVCGCSPRIIKAALCANAVPRGSPALTEAHSDCCWLLAAGLLFSCTRSRVGTAAHPSNKSRSQDRACRRPVWVATTAKPHLDSQPRKRPRTRSRCTFRQPLTTAAQRQSRPPDTLPTPEAPIDRSTHSRRLSPDRRIVALRSCPLALGRASRTCETRRRRLAKPHGIRRRHSILSRQRRERRYWGDCTAAL
jgi:hypothetical protein